MIGNAFVGTATPYYVEQGHFYLESNNVKDGQINHNSEIFINDEFYEKQKDKWLHTGDMVMVQSGHVGHAAVIPEVLDNTAAHALIMFRNPKEKIEPYFLNFEYQTNKSKKKIENITTGNTIKHILASDMQEFEVDVPKYEEQKAIAEYFANLDNLITLHQREFKYVYCRFVINEYKYIRKNYICIYTKIYGGLKMNNKLELYHGSGQIVEFPEIRKTRYTKDFSWGFYCTKSYEQSYRWAERKHENGIVNVYSYIENSELNIKKFDGMCEEWLDFIAECRAGKTHPYDIVEGPMADDTIWNFVNDYLNKNISKEVFWEYARFKHPSHQISFHSIRALECLKYERSIAVENDTVE